MDSHRYYNRDHFRIFMKGTVQCTYIVKINYYKTESLKNFAEVKFTNFEIKHLCIRTNHDWPQNEIQGHFVRTL